MGDTGSQFLGFVLGVLSIIVTQKPSSALNPLLPLFLLGLPIVDTAMVMLKRLQEGRSLFAPDKNHFHHQLLTFGVAHYEAVAVIYLVQMLFVGCALLLRFESDLLVFGVYIALFGTIMLLLYVASARGWQVRHEGITRFISAVDKSPGARQLPVSLLSCGISLYLVGGSVAATRVSPDLVMAALFLLVVLLPRLVWAEKLRFIPLRILVFPTIAFAVYLINYNARAAELIPLDLRVGLFVVVAILMIFAVRYARREAFQTTPTDLLVIALAGAVGVMYEYQILDDKLVPLMVELVVLFYAGEMVMRQMKGVWNCFTVGMVAVLALISSELLI
jgi:UDP-GlcNAc:undecaprenyl-phosphate GlcNAc-1-phosphate transferase